MLRVEKVSKERFLPSGERVRVLDGIDLEAASARITAVIGPSGGGKSTLLRLINRLEEADAGRIEVEGTDIRACDPLELRRRVVMVLQSPFMYPGTVLDNLQHPFLLQGRVPPSGESSEVRKCLELCSLGMDLLPNRAGTLSVGQQQRLCLARVLLLAPRVLLLDEPTSALDRPTADHLAETLRRICRQEGVTILVVAHDLRLVKRCADVVAYLEKGRILEYGPCAELLSAPRTDSLRRFLAEPDEQGDEVP